MDRIARGGLRSRHLDQARLLNRRIWRRRGRIRMHRTAPDRYGVMWLAKEGLEKSGTQLPNGGFEPPRRSR